jgi:ABC-2 type transport system ATP-binding protein
MNTVIHTDGLTRTFGTLHAVDHIRFDVPRGIVFGFLGPNGSGKTTTIRLLLGLLEPTDGSAQVLGFDTVRQADQIRQRCGALLEHTGLYERMSAQDNLELYGRIWHLSRGDRQARIQETLTSLGLWERRGEIVAAWSRGMKQKLAVARTLLHRPELVFLDEPTAGLDPVAAASLHEDLERITKQQGVTVFLTTHNLAEAEKLCRQVAVIRQGQILAVGSPDELRQNQGDHRLEILGRGITEDVLATLRAHPQVSAVEFEGQHLVIHLRNQDDTSGLVGQLVTQGVQIDEVRKGKASLEEAFLSLVEETKEQE